MTTPEDSPNAGEERQDPMKMMFEKVMELIGPLYKHAGGPNGETVATLPDGYRPAHPTVIPMMIDKDGYACSVRCSPDGRVEIGAVTAPPGRTALVWRHARAVFWRVRWRLRRLVGDQERNPFVDGDVLGLLGSPAGRAELDHWLEQRAGQPLGELSRDQLRYLIHAAYNDDDHLRDGLQWERELAEAEDEEGE